MQVPTISGVLNVVIWATNASLAHKKNVDNEQLVSVESTENGSFKDNDIRTTVEMIKTRQKVTKKRRFSEGVTEQHNDNYVICLD